jgi:hypothetical protein
MPVLARFNHAQTAVCDEGAAPADAVAARSGDLAQSGVRWAGSKSRRRTGVTRATPYGAIAIRLRQAKAARRFNKRAEPPGVYSTTV